MAASERYSSPVTLTGTQPPAGVRTAAATASTTVHFADVSDAEIDAYVATGEPLEVASGRTVFVDATAAWCLSCQVNARTSLHTDAVEAAFRAADVALFRADWTNRDPAITAFLARFGRSGVPLYAFYPGGGAAPVLLPEVLTPGIVLDVLAAAARPTAAR